MIAFSFLLAIVQSREHIQLGKWVFQQHEKLKQFHEDVTSIGNQVTSSAYSLEHKAGWLPATVPGSVLTSMIQNNFWNVTDPYFEQNLKQIPDISEIGREYYTAWFVNEFELSTKLERQWLSLRGINYKAAVYFNEHEVPPMTDGDGYKQDVQGMFLRHQFDLTPYVRAGTQRLAILVEPPVHPGKPGGQGGNHEIAQDVAAQFTAGWDWIRASPDRVTGIWDRVDVFNSGPILLRHPHVITRGTSQVKVSATVEALNNGDQRDVVVQFSIAGQTVQKPIRLPQGITVVTLPDISLNSPKLWWPYGYGDANLYTVTFTISEGSAVSDEVSLRVGIRDVRSEIDPFTKGRKFYVNEVAIFIRGGNWITTDQFLRFATDRQRYYNEVRMHRDMNMNFIRVWGGGITERPEFYEAADELGMLVLQEFWMSGDNNGRWAGSYDWPEDHNLYIASARDTVRMLRNHPSLLFWCGGNELDPPAKNPSPDIEFALEAATRGVDTAPQQVLDGTRPYIQSSMGSSDPEFALAPADGPYRIMEPRLFFARSPGLSATVVFNPEVGYQGDVPVVESMRRMLSNASLSNFPKKAETTFNEAWDYHHMVPYSTSAGRDMLYNYRPVVNNIDDYCEAAQIVNFVHNRAMMEGYSYQMWRWYTGVVIWKSQGPWPALRGHLYDWWLDQTGGFYGVRTALEMQHVQLSLPNQTDLVVTVVNLGAAIQSPRIEAIIVDVDGKVVGGKNYSYSSIPASTSFLGDALAWPSSSVLAPQRVGFVKLTLFSGTQTLSRNVYWMTAPTTVQDFSVDFPALKEKKAALTITIEKIKTDESILRWRVTVSAPQLAVFIRLGVVKVGVKGDPRVLPTWTSDNFFTLFPKDSNQVIVECSSADAGPGQLALTASAWNSPLQQLKL